MVVRQSPPDQSPREQAETDTVEDGLIAGLQAGLSDRRGATVVGAERTSTDPSSIEYFSDQGLSSVDNVDQLPGQVSLVYAARGRRGRVRGQGHGRRAAAGPAGAREPTVRGREAPLMLSGLIVSALVAALALGPWLTDMARAGLVRSNYAARRVAFPAGAPLIACSLIALAPLAVLDDRADLDLLDPGLQRWMVYVLGVALLGLLDDALGRGGADDTARGWRGHARAVSSGRFSTGAIKAVGALALAATATSAWGSRGSTTSPTCCSC